MFAQERQNAIKKIVRERRRLNFAALQKLIGVSPATLRRDLTDLENSGEIVRVHGGVMDPGFVRSEISFDERVLHHHAAKKAIAVRANSLIPAGASVFVDAGSTCLEAGKILLSRKDIRIITHSVALIAISLHGQAELVSLGGALRRVSGALVGGAALGALLHIHADYALIGASGMNIEGCSTTELSEAEMKRAILARSARKILLADSSKWQEPSTISFAKWAEVTDWVTEKKLSLEDEKFMQTSEVELCFA